MRSILLVEDSKLLRYLNNRVLCKAGYTVITAADGEEAIRMARERLPDLILLDMLLPKVSGVQVLHTLRNDPNTAHIPVLVLSSLPQANEEKVKEDGATAYFEKSKLDLDKDSAPLLKAVRDVFESDTTARCPLEPLTAT